MKSEFHICGPWANASGAGSTRDDRIETVLWQFGEYQAKRLENPGVRAAHVLRIIGLSIQWQEFDVPIGTRNSLVGLLWLGLGIGLYPGALHAAEGPVCPPAPITVAVSDFGYYYMPGSAGHPHSGYDADVLDLLHQRTGCVFKEVVMPWARAWTELSLGHIDASVATIVTTERKRVAYFVTYTQARNRVLLLSGAPQSYETVEGFLADPKARFGVVRGYAQSAFYAAAFDRLRAAGRLVEFTNDRQLLQALIHADVAAMIADAMVFRRLLAEEGEGVSVRVLDWDPARTPNPSGLALSKSRFSAQDAAAWRKIMVGLQADGSLRRSLEKYLPPDEAAEVSGVAQPPAE